MQNTRERILQQLGRQHCMSVEDLAGVLDLSPMTIRHHLAVLQRDGLIEAQTAGRRDRPGRPQLLYALTPAGLESFPSNLAQLTDLILDQVKRRVDAGTFERILTGVAQGLAGSFAPAAGAEPEERLDQIVSFLNNVGYQADWAPDGVLPWSYLLRMGNCPYRRVAQRHGETCLIDQRLLAHLSGAVVERVGREYLPADQRAAPTACIYRLSWAGAAGNADSVT